MKRSVVLNFLATHFYYCNVEPDEADEKAELVLSTLEKMGMLPPYNPPNLDHGSIQDCVWEPEQEMTDEELSKL